MVSAEHLGEFARVVAQGLARDLPQPVVIENRGGGNGTIGSEAVTRGPADGTLFLALNRGPGKDTRGREVAFFDAVTQQLVHRLTTATASATPTTPRTEITRWSRTTATPSSP